jgi:hypothetical protein
MFDRNRDSLEMSVPAIYQCLWTFACTLGTILQFLNGMAEQKKVRSQTFHLRQKRQVVQGPSMLQCGFESIAEEISE